jgi:hypothetical protein
MFAVSLSCHSPAHASIQPLPACPPPLADTMNWRSYDAGDFTILLPRTARPAKVQCIDTACGEVRVGGWTLEYDAGFLVGHTIMSAPPLLNTPNEVQCVVRADAYDWVLAMFRTERGTVGGDARVLRWPGGRITITMQGRSPNDLVQFATAVRTARARRQ